MVCLRTMSPRSVGLMGEMARFWISSGKADEILSRVQVELAQRRAKFMEVFKGFDFRCEPGSPFGWLGLPEGWTGSRLAATLRARRIAITPGTAFDLAGKNNGAQHVRICFGSPQANWRPMPTFEEIRAVIEAGEDELIMPVA